MSAQSMNSLVVQYSYLQILDFLTTIAFLLNGVREANPIARLFIEHAPNPLTGLLVLKGIAILLGVFCWRMGRQRLLFRINLLFAVVVAWNLLALIVGSAS